MYLIEKCSSSIQFLVIWISFQMLAIFFYFIYFCRNWIKDNSLHVIMFFWFFFYFLLQGSILLYIIYEYIIHHSWCGKGLQDAFAIFLVRNLDYKMLLPYYLSETYLRWKIRKTMLLRNTLFSVTRILFHLFKWAKFSASGTSRISSAEGCCCLPHGSCIKCVRTE